MTKLQESAADLILAKKYQELNEDKGVSVLHEGDKPESEYQEFVNKKLKEKGVDSPFELPKDEMKKFFNKIDKEWIGDSEKDEKYDSQYEKFFNKKLKEKGVDSPFELSKDKMKEFFEEVDKEWKADKET